MQYVRISDVLTGKYNEGTEVTIKGWVRTRRDSKAGVSFIHVHDGSCFDPLQVVVPSELPDYHDMVLHLTTGCSVIVYGRLVASQGKGQSLEVAAESIEVAGWVDDPDTYPMQPKQHTFEHLREYAHLRMRTNVIGAVMRIRNTLSRAIHDYLQHEGFIWVHTPIITSSDCEGAGELFRVTTLNAGDATADVNGANDFFGRKTFLTVSGQLNVETYCQAFSRVYTFGPTFRAENSNTSRHLSEFWMVEPEIAFADLDEDMRVAWDFLQHVCRVVLDERSDDMAFFAQRVDKGCMDRVQKLVDSDFVHMTYTDAVSALEKSGEQFEYPVHWGANLQSEHERWLTEQHVGRPVIVTDYPKQIKGFYMKLNGDDRTVAAMDVLVPGTGEIIGGSQREDRLEVLDRRMDELGMDRNIYWWYRDLRRYGSVPHAGFGLGLERLIMYVTGMGNIRDVIPFPRTPMCADY